MYVGQTRSVFCEEFGGQRVQTAKYREGELYFWCSHNKIREIPREVIDKKTIGGTIHA